MFERRSQTGDVEQRTIVVPELRVDDGPDGPVIDGYAAVFNALSVDLGGFREQIAPGTFARAIAEGSDVRSLLNHDPNWVFGRTRAGTLVLAEDEFGLRQRTMPPDAQWARDAIVSIRRGDINQMSFAFRTIKDRWEQDENGLVTRTLLDVELRDVSFVTFPAYPQTSAQVRAQLEVFAGAGQEPSAGDEDSDEAGRARARLAMLRRRLDLYDILMWRQR